MPTLFQFNEHTRLFKGIDFASENSRLLSGTICYRAILQPQLELLKRRRAKLLRRKSVCWGCKSILQLRSPTASTKLWTVLYLIKCRYANRLEPSQYASLNPKVLQREQSRLQYAQGPQYSMGMGQSLPYQSQQSASYIQPQYLPPQKQPVQQPYQYQR